MNIAEHTTLISSGHNSRASVGKEDSDSSPGIEPMVRGNLYYRGGKQHLPKGAPTVAV